LVERVCIVAAVWERFIFCLAMMEWLICNYSSNRVIEKLRANEQTRANHCGSLMQLFIRTTLGQLTFEIIFQCNFGDWIPKLQSLCFYALKNVKQKKTYG
jgi:hypothetical protein